MKSYSDSYKAAGVDVTAGYKAVELMKAHVAKTMTSGVLSGIGGFGGLFELDVENIKKPVLVSGTDGVNKGGSPTDQIEYEYASKFQYDRLTTFWALSGLWGNCYYVVSTSNSALESLENYAKHLTSSQRR